MKSEKSGNLTSNNFDTTFSKSYGDQSLTKDTIDTEPIITTEQEESELISADDLM